MGLLRVGLLQMNPVGRDLEANLRKGETFCREAAAQRCDIALFPEMWSVGCWIPQRDRPDDHADWAARAISRDHAAVRRFQDLARDRGMAIAITYLEPWPNAPRNSVSVIDRNGEIVLTYAKVHTCDFDVEIQLSPGDAFPVATLDTAVGGIAIGCMICYDREFPETARILALNGAEIILTPNACDVEAHRIAQFRTRAFENMVGVAMTNYAAPRNNGRSIAFSPICFAPDEGSVDNLLVEADDSEGVFIADFDMDAIRDYRQREIWGGKFRRPDLYGPLTPGSGTPPR